MANVLVNEQSLFDIADALRARLNVQTTFKPTQMAAAIESIPGGAMPSFHLSGNAFYTVNESSMSIIRSDTQLQTVWLGTSNIGAMFIYPFAIPAEVKSISYHLSTGSCYSNTNVSFKLTVALRESYSTTVIGSDVAFLAANKHSTKNMAETECSLDCSAVNQIAYLYILAHGWNATLKSIALHF